MVSEALFAALLDLLAGFGFAALLFAAIVAVLALMARQEKRLSERKVEPKPEVVEAFSQFPDPAEWRRKARSRCDQEAA